MDELLQRAAEKMGMPPALAERSAQAKAAKTGSTVEAVLREWAGDDASGDTPEEAAPTAPVPSEAPASADDGPAPASGPTEVTVDYLVALAAEAKRMPAKLVLSSAEARARNSGSEVEVVLATWAGVDLRELREQAAAGEAPAIAAPVPEAEDTPRAPEQAAEPADGVAEPEPAPDRVSPATAAVAGAALSMDELLDKVAEAKGMPAPLAKRSAEARAKKTGEPLEAVLAEWAGVDASAVADVSATQAPAAEAAPAPREDQGPDGDADGPDGEDKDGVEVIEADEPVVDDIDTVEDDDIDAEPATRGGYPAWLAAAFVIIPLLAVVYILTSPNGPDCGVAGQLGIDEATGLAVNCDGSDYGSSEIDYFARGGAIFAQCAACHGANGEGGAGPAMAGGAILTTFPAGMCSDQIEWVTLGTANFPEPTYGATDRPVGGVGVMPSYENQLSQEEIASVVMYERVQFGGQPLEEAQVDCGLADDEADADGATTEAAPEG